MIFAAAARPSTIVLYLPELMQPGTPPTTPACRAVSISRALSGAPPAPSSGCMANSAEWNRRNASLFSSPTQWAAFAARVE